MKTSRYERCAGFSLGELGAIVVIASLLTAIALPSLLRARRRDRVTATMINGVNLVKSFSSVCEPVSPPPYRGWPQSGETDPGHNRFGSSTDFYLFLVTARMINVTYDFFAAPGIPPAADESEFSARNNAWALVAGVDYVYPETAPVLFTRNLGLREVGEPLIPDPARGHVSDRLAPPYGDEMTANPFGARAMALVTRSGAGFALMRDDLRMDNFSKHFVQTDAHGNVLTNIVLRP